MPWDGYCQLPFTAELRQHVAAAAARVAARGKAGSGGLCLGLRSPELVCLYDCFLQGSLPQAILEDTSRLQNAGYPSLAKAVERESVRRGGWG